MKRSVKNILLVVVLCLAILGMYFTMSNAKNDVVSNTNEPEMMNNGNMETPPDMPDNEQNNGDTEEPPELPSDNGQAGENGENTPPDMPNDNATDNSLETPPDMPSESGSGTPPDMPGENESGTMSNNTMSTEESDNDYVYLILYGVQSLIIASIVTYLVMSGCNAKSVKDTLASSDKTIIYVLTIIILTVGLTVGANMLSDALPNNHQNTNQNQNEQGGMSSSNVAYSSKNEITESTTLSSGEYTSDTADENALLISGDIDVTISDITIEKTGDSDGGDNTSFYGTNSGIIAKEGANVTIKNITVETNATGANGVFSYGGSATTNNSSSDGTTINISNSKITTNKDNSGGIMTTGGGIMNASNLEILTAGISSAAIRTDRGGGTVIVDGGTYKTTGAGSPTVYSTADVTVKNADLIATTAEGIVIEGKNKVTIENVTLTDTNSKLNGQSTTYKNIFLYQSMSGDAAEGISEFSAKNSTITTNKGDTLYVTNTSSKITLTNNTIVNNDTTGNFLRVQKDSWGNSGSNGGTVTLILTNQKAVGNIVIDSISTLDMTMEESSYYEGTINGENTAKEITLIMDKTSQIKLTGDSYITSLENADTDNSNIDFNGYKLYVNGKSIQ